MENNLRSLIVNYGLANVHTALQNVVNGLITDLQKMTGSAPAPAPVPVVEEVKPVEEVKAEPEKKKRGRKTKETPVVPEVKKEPVVEVKKATPTKEEQKKKKELHTEVITKKRDEMLAQNQNPMAMLTEKNMKEWIGQNMSYWTIAEQTGCWDYEVSNKAKEYNLKSPVSMMIAKKKAKV